MKFQTLQRDHRTNNLCEEWNNKFARLVGHSYPTTWNCIAALQRDETCSRRTIIQFEIGEEEPRQHSAVYSSVEARLQHLCIRYTIYFTLTSFLRREPCGHLHFYPNYPLITLSFHLWLSTYLIYLSALPTKHTTLIPVLKRVENGGCE